MEQSELSRTDCEEYLRLHAEVATRSKRMDQLRESILPGLRAGAISPADLPYSLTRRIQSRTIRDYKTPLFRALHGIFGKREATKQMETIESKFETTDVEQLCVEINKAYAAHLEQ
jgi:hypothetical protein